MPVEKEAQQQMRRSRGSAAGRAACTWGGVLTEMGALRSEVVVPAWSCQHADAVGGKQTLPDVRCAREHMEHGATVVNTVESRAAHRDGTEFREGAALYAPPSRRDARSGAERAL